MASTRWCSRLLYSEKAAYQEVVALYGLPTDEKIDANDIYMKLFWG